jgi:hypothetical protein
MSDNGYSYVARKSCGCMVAAVVDDAAHKRDVAREMAAWVRDGLTVERVTHDVVRAEFVGRKCPHVEQQLSLF